MTTAANDEEEDPDIALARQLQAEYDAEVKAKEAKERFQCAICMEESRLDKGVELDCQHRFCNDCFTGFLTIKIKEKQVKEEELCCLMPECSQRITVPQVEGLTAGTKLWERFLETRAELWRPTPSAPSCGAPYKERELLCECPVAQCSEKFLVSPRGGDVSCPRCRAIFCRTCQQAHPGRTCDQFKAETERNAATDADLERLIAENRWQRCPRCRAVTQRDTGCNYMTCQSEKCRGKVSFCYLCGDELSTVEHYTHFPRGLFENACVKVDRREDEALPPAEWGSKEWFDAVARDIRKVFVG